MYYTDQKGAPSNEDGIKWYNWLGGGHSLKSSTLMISKNKKVGTQQSILVIYGQAPAPGADTAV